MIDGTELNEIKHVGVKPAIGQDSIRTYTRIPDGGTQFFLYSSTAGAAIVGYTVPGGTTLYLMSGTFQMKNISGGNGDGWVRLMTGGAVEQYRFLSCACPTWYSVNIHATFNPPMEIPAGYYIQLSSNAAAVATSMSLHGWTE